LRKRQEGEKNDVSRVARGEKGHLRKKNDCTRENRGDLEKVRLLKNGSERRVERSQEGKPPGERKAKKPPQPAEEYAAKIQTGGSEKNACQTSEKKKITGIIL